MDIGDSILIIKTLYPGYDNEIVIAPKTLLAPAEEGEGREWDKKECFYVVWVDGVLFAYIFTSRTNLLRLKIFKKKIHALQISFAIDTSIFACFQRATTQSLMIK